MVTDPNKGSERATDRLRSVAHGKWIDFHTHILPGMDDGSRSVEESLEMLDASAQQGVGCVVLTPHFYADSDKPDRFLNRRAKSLGALRKQAGADSPLLIPGAEVQYFSGITVMDELPQLCIEGTGLLLLEMPFQKWPSRVIDDVLELNSRQGLQVMIAHLERYIGAQPRGVLEVLLANHVLIQANAEFFVNRFSRRKALSMLKQGCIHLLGSDCHDMQSRPPMLGACMEIIQMKLGVTAADDIQQRAMGLLREHEAAAEKALVSNGMINI